METEHISIDTISSYKVLHARVIRSTIPRGKLKSIQFPQLPEGYYSITYKDIPGINSIDVFNETIPLLCEGEITYEGEPLAVLCGPEKRKVITLCKNTRIEYETDYSLLGFNTYTEDQVIAEKTFSKGSAEKIFTEAFQTVEGNIISVHVLLILPPFRVQLRQKTKIYLRLKLIHNGRFICRKALPGFARYLLKKYS